MCGRKSILKQGDHLRRNGTRSDEWEGGHFGPGSKEPQEVPWGHEPAVQVDEWSEIG